MNCICQLNFCLLLSLLFISGSWWFPLPVEAAEWIVDPGISWKGTYDDNILFEEASDFESRLRPGLELTRRTERGEVSASGVVDIISYLDNSQYDRENQDYRLQADYALSPRLTGHLSSRTAIDYTFDEFWEEEGIITDKSKRYSYSLSPGLRYALNERTSLDFNVQASMTDYEEDLNPDYNVLGATLAWSMAVLDGRSELLAQTSAQQVVYDLGQDAETEQEIYRLLLGARYRFSKTLDLVVRLGPMWTESRFDHALWSTTENDLSYALESSLNWRLERSRLGLDISRSEAQSTYGENIIRDRISARVAHTLNARWRANLRGSFIQSQTEGYIQDEESEAVSLQAAMSYVLSPTMDLSLGYNYRRSQDKIDNDTETGNRLYVEYSVRFPQQW